MQKQKTSLINTEVKSPPLTLCLLALCLRRDLLNCMLATSCQQGHLDVVRLLVHGYDADVKDFAVHSDEFAVINGLPLYAAAQASTETHVHSNTFPRLSLLSHFPPFVFSSSLKSFYSCGPFVKAPKI